MIKFLLQIICVLFSFSPLNISAQYQVENLVFEGAGIRGIAYAGAIKELEKNNILASVERVGGTSAGAITALMLALGYTSEEIITIIHSTSFKRFNDNRLFFFGGFVRLKNKYGWYRGEKFTKWLEQIIASKTGNRNITFDQLNQAGYKKLYVTGTSLTGQQVIIFSHEKFPQMRIADAVRISMSIPLYFEPLYMNREGEIIHKPHQKDSLHLLVDGGFSANFPIKLFDSTKYAGESANEYFINSKTIGFRIDREEQIAYDSVNQYLAPFVIKNLKDYVNAFYNLIIENLNRQNLTEDDWKRTISIKDGNISPRIRKLSKKELNLLTENGSKATANFLLPKLN